MNLRIAVLGLLLVAQTGVAQVSATGAGADERSALLQSLTRGKQIKGSRDRFEHLPQVSAVALAAASESPQQAMARSGEGSAQIVETKGRLVLFRGAQRSAALARSAGGALVFPTVVNVRTGVLGVLTGALIVKPKNMADAAAIAASHGLALSKAYPKLRTVFYKIKPGADIADASVAVQADPRVESAYPEIVEYVPVPM